MRFYGRQISHKNVVPTSLDKPGQEFVTLLSMNESIHWTSSGMKLALVSNFDTRLRPLLTAMGAADIFDALIISAEVTPLVSPA